MLQSLANAIWIVYGMSNNLPLHPLPREGRSIDIVVCFDASTDIKQGNWVSIADVYAKQRGATYGRAHGAAGGSRKKKKPGKSWIILTQQPHNKQLVR